MAMWTGKTPPPENTTVFDPLRPLLQADSPLLIGQKKKADRNSLVIRKNKAAKAQANSTVTSPTMGASLLLPTLV
jgi:hypothetical protein